LIVKKNVALVAIGRNEGERLRRCLVSAKLSEQIAVVVYVDSGSTDGSVEMALGLGCEIVLLDMTTPFTAARARNEGFARAIAIQPDVEFVQFVDGDCELVMGWIPAALDLLQQRSEVAAVCGRRRERYPERSIYNKLCDFEWEAPAGIARSCGGDVMMRVNAFVQAGGYRSSLIAGEEPELCVRLRSNNWQIWRLDREMTLHDAAMYRFGQWWTRTKRAGHAFAEVSLLHRTNSERHHVRETLRAIGWGVILPALIVVAAIWRPWCIAAVLIYPLQVVRVYLSDDQAGSIGWLRAVFLVLGKFPEAHGMLTYLVNVVRHRRSTLIEYK
jgi:glycosyltransferase involved in cell wall biosynthesis